MPRLITRGSPGGACSAAAVCEVLKRAEATFRNGRKQVVPAGKVIVGRGLRHARGARDGAERERLGAVALQQCGGSGDQRAPEIAVVIAARGRRLARLRTLHCAGSLRRFHVDTVNIVS